MSWAGSYLGMLGLLKEAAIGGVMGGLAGTALYGAGKAFGFLKDSVKDVWGEGRAETSNNQVDFYVTPNGEAVHSIGYRYSARNTQIIQSAKNGYIDAKSGGMYFF